MSEQTTLGKFEGMRGMAKQNEIYIIYVQNEKAQTIETNEWTRIETVNLDRCTFPPSMPWIIVIVEVRGGGSEKTWSLSFHIETSMTLYILHFTNIDCLASYYYYICCQWIHTPTRDCWNFYVQSVHFVYISNQKEVFCVCCMVFFSAKLSKQHIFIDDSSFEVKWKLHFDSE